jgi:hypothetical protein
MKEHVFEQATLVADVTNHPVVWTARCTVNSAQNVVSGCSLFGSSTDGKAEHLTGKKCTQ